MKIQFKSVIVLVFFASLATSAEACFGRGKNKDQCICYCQDGTPPNPVPPYPNPPYPVPPYPVPPYPLPCCEYNDVALYGSNRGGSIPNRGGFIKSPPRGIVQTIGSVPSVGTGVYTQPISTPTVVVNPVTYTQPISTPAVVNVAVPTTGVQTIQTVPWSGVATRPTAVPAYPTTSWTGVATRPTAVPAYPTTSWTGVATRPTAVPPYPTASWTGVATRPTAVPPYPTTSWTGVATRPTAVPPYPTASWSGVDTRPTQVSYPNWYPGKINQLKARLRLIRQRGEYLAGLIQRCQYYQRPTVSGVVQTPQQYVQKSYPRVMETINLPTVHYVPTQGASLPAQTPNVPTQVISSPAQIPQQVPAAPTIQPVLPKRRCTKCTATICRRHL